MGQARRSCRAMSEALIKSLERTRAGYEAELVWHRFLYDAYTGGGGFEGRVQRASAGGVGDSCARYATASDDECESYLDKFPAESAKKFQARCDAAHYDNYVQPLTDLKVSFMLAKPLSVTDRPEAVQRWHEDMDGRGTSFEEVHPNAVLRGGIFGWNPAVVDLPAIDGEVETKAQEQAAGLTRPSLVILTPSNLLDFETDESGDLEWAKIRTTEERRDSWDKEPYQVDVYTVWQRTTYSKYEVSHENAQKAVTVLAEDASHRFGVVPVAILRHKQAVLGSLLGLPMHAEVSQANRALFNRVSELEEVLRQSAFPILVLAQSEGETDDGERVIAANTAITIDHDSGQKHYYLEMSGISAEALETRIKNTVRELYRMARVEYDRDSGTEASGEARAYDFAQTNAAIADFAAQDARFVAWVDDLVGRALGVPEEERKRERVVAPKDFDVENLAALIKSALDAIKLELGPTATRLLKERVAGQLLPGLAPADQKAIAKELEEEAKAPEPEPVAPSVPAPPAPTPEPAAA